MKMQKAAVSGIADTKAFAVVRVPTVELRVLNCQGPEGGVYAMEISYTLPNAGSRGYCCN